MSDQPTMRAILDALDAIETPNFLAAMPYAEDEKLWAMRNTLFDVHMRVAKLHDVLRRIVTLPADQKEAPQAPSYCKALPGQCVSIASMDGASCPRGCFEPRTYGKPPDIPLCQACSGTGRDPQSNATAWLMCGVCQGTGVNKWAEKPQPVADADDWQEVRHAILRIESMSGILAREDNPSERRRYAELCCKADETLVGIIARRVAEARTAALRDVVREAKLQSLAAGNVVEGVVGAMLAREN